MPSFREPTQCIHFHNNTDLPVNISAWQKNSNIMHSIVVRPQEKKILHSSVGEWHMDSMFNDDSECDVWKTAGLGKHLIIGKFRSDPCASGNYSWMEYYEPFECVYSEIDSEENVKGLITFVKIKKE